MANDFANGRLQPCALYTQEGSNIANAYDTSGNGNDLAFNFSGLGFDSSDYREGSQSRGPNASGTLCASRSDVNLSAGFPGKGGGALGDLSIVTWAKWTSITNYQHLIGKHYNTAGNAAGYGIYLNATGTPDRIVGFIPYGAGGDSAELFVDTGTSIVSGRWYHIAFTYEYSSKNWRIRIWDDTAQSVAETTGTGSQTAECSTRAFTIFNKEYWLGSEAFLGRLDGTAVFAGILTADEIDEIRAGIYGNDKKGPGLMMGCHF